VLYEEMNLAQLWKLPVIYACENNMYNEYTHYTESTAGEILKRPAAFGMAAEEVDGQDVRAVYATAQKYVERARRGEGPAFLLLNTYRYHGHHVGDVATLRAIYRPKAEEEAWMTGRDPIRRFVDSLLADNVADKPSLERIEQELVADMNAAVEFAVNAPFPAADKVDQDIYA
jgi:pyruvate dehydrogenase E1 component alpha subunit